MFSIKYATFINVFSKLISTRIITPWDQINYHYSPSVEVINLIKYGFSAMTIKDYQEKDPRNIVCLKGRNEDILKSCINEGLRFFSGKELTKEEAYELANKFQPQRTISSNIHKDTVISKPTFNKEGVITRTSISLL